MDVIGANVNAFVTAKPLKPNKNVGLNVFE